MIPLFSGYLQQASKLLKGKFYARLNAGTNLGFQAEAQCLLYDCWNLMYIIMDSECTNGLKTHVVHSNLTYDI